MQDALTKFTADIGSAYWWLSAVVIAMLVNILSSYVKSWLDSTGRKHVAKREHEKQQDSGLQFGEALEQALRPEHMAFHAQRETRLWLFCLIFLAASILPVAAMGAYAPYDPSPKGYVTGLHLLLLIASIFLLFGSMVSAQLAFRQANIGWLGRHLADSHTPAELKELLELHKKFGPKVKSESGRESGKDA